MTDSLPARRSAMARPEEGERRPLGFATRAIHEGRRYASETGAVVAPVYLSSTFARGNPGGFDYTRSGNPNFSNLEETLASLEEARHAVAFSSGVAAITAVISSLESGDEILAEENLYGCTYRLFEAVFRKFGVRATYLDLADPANLPQIASRRPRMVWIESPTNPLLKVLDIAAIAEAAEAVGASLIVDNTFACSYFQRPLALGAELSLMSTTKYIGGHSDCLGGVVCTNSGAWAERLRFAQKALGLQPAPLDSWLTLRGVQTLALRMRQHEANARRLAAFLEASSGVERVYYPYLGSHPAEPLARRQMTGGGGIVSATLALPPGKVDLFLRGLRLFTVAESLGAVESLICHPATMSHAAIPAAQREALGIGAGLVRFSVGIEEADDLCADVAQAFSKREEGASE